MRSLLLALLLAWPSMLTAQYNQLTFSKGIGRFVARPASQRSRIGSLTYTRGINDVWAIEAGMDWFFLPGDGFSGFRLRGLYHFRPATEIRTIVPYVAFGIGNTSTDFTELATHAVYHAGGGVNYFVTEWIGIQAEFENRMIHAAHDSYLQGEGKWADLAGINLGVSLRW